MDSSTPGLAFVRSLVRDAVLIKPRFLGVNFRDVIHEQLRTKHEGACSRHGYILSGSIAMHRVSLGHVEAATLNGDVRFDVQYYASICNPPVGSRLAARVINMNKFGLLAHSGVQAPDGTFVPVIETIVTRHVTGMASEVDLDEVGLGDVINVEILGKKFELRDRKISVIGRVVKRIEVPSAADAASALLPAALDALGLDAARRRERRAGRSDADSDSGSDRSGVQAVGGDGEEEEETGGEDEVTDDEEEASEAEEGSLAEEDEGSDAGAGRGVGAVEEVDGASAVGGSSEDNGSSVGSDASDADDAGSAQSGGGGEFDYHGDDY